MAGFLLARVSGYFVGRRNEIMRVDPSTIRILSVDDHPLLREGIAALVASQSDMKLVAEASTGREALEQFRKHRPDLTLMDLEMPDMNGILFVLDLLPPGSYYNPKEEFVTLLNEFLTHYKKENQQKVDTLSELHRDFRERKSIFLTMLDTYMRTNMLHKMKESTNVFG